MDMVYHIQPLHDERGRRATAVVAKTQIGRHTHVFRAILHTKPDWTRFYEWIEDMEAASFAQMLFPTKPSKGQTAL